MTPEPPDDDDPGPDAAEIGFWAASREQHRIRRTIILGVQRRRSGKTTAAIADELRREFAAARMPEPPEQVEQWAVAITRHRWPGTHFVGQLVDLAVHRRTPSWLGLEEQKLPGRRWVPVYPADTPLARIAVRRYHRLQDFLRQINPAALLPARLIGMPGPGGDQQIAVLLGAEFAGTLDPDHAIAVTSVVDEAERANRKLTIDSRIDDAGGLSVSIPE